MPDITQIKADALAFVNRLRTACGEDALTALPKGRREDATDCPIAVALRPLAADRLVTVDAVWIEGLNDRAEEELLDYCEGQGRTPQVVDRFIAAFDGGGFPELELEGSDGATDYRL